MTLVEKIKLWFGILNKKCSSCEEYKNINKFYNNSNGIYGKSSRCKVCNKRAVKEWKRKNRRNGL